MRKAIIDGKMVSVITSDEYRNSSVGYLDQGSTAVHIGDTVFPIKGKNDCGPGIYRQNQCVSIVVRPPEEEKEYYSSNNIVDFSDVKSMAQLMEKQNELKSMERTILTDADNIFKPIQYPDDTHIMAGLKESVIRKEIDLEKYKHRFESVSAFNNERREFNKKSITFNKFVSFCKIFDLDATMIIKDKEGAPNPIGEPIVVNMITGGEED